MFVLVSVPFTYGQATAGDSKVTSEQITDDTVQLMRQDIRSQRKKLVAANLPLTEAEAVKFWPVYDRYVQEHSKIYDTRYGLIKDYSKTYDSMSDAQANSLIKHWIATDESMAQLRLKWIAEFEKVISPKKTEMFFQIDRQLGLILETQLASQIPLMKP